METENNEQKGKEAEGKETPESDKDKGNVPEAIGAIQRANEARQGLAKENERLEKNLAELKELTARNILSGEALAGSPAEGAKIDSPEEYANKALKGQLEYK